MCCTRRWTVDKCDSTKSGWLGGGDGERARTFLAFRFLWRLFIGILGQDGGEGAKRDASTKEEVCGRACGGLAGTREGGRLGLDSFPISKPSM